MTAPEAGTGQKVKRCGSCAAVKPLADFPPRGSGRYKGACRECLGVRPQALAHRRGAFTPNRHRVEGEGVTAVGIIELTDREGRTIAEARVSVADLPRVVAAGRWHASRRDHTTYVARSHREGGKPGMQWLHRFILAPSEGQWVDHISGDGLDNRRENLRAVTAAENGQNKRATRGRSGVKNVCWDARKGKWFVAVTINGVTTHYGYFASVEEAAPVAEAARKGLHTHSPENSESPS